MMAMCLTCKGGEVELQGTRPLLSLLTGSSLFGYQIGLRLVFPYFS